MTAPLVIDSDELACRLAALKTQTIIAITIETTPARAMRKTGNPFWNPTTKRWALIKRSRTSGLIGTRYAETVWNRQKKAAKQSGASHPQNPDWSPRPATWGRRMPGLPFRVYASSLYLEFHEVRTYEVKFLDATTGEEVPLESYRQWLVHREQKQKAKAARRQELEPERVVDWRDFKLSSIRWLSLWGEVFQVQPVLRATERKAKPPRPRFKPRLKRGPRNARRRPE